MPYLDQSGLSKLWARCKAVFAPKASPTLTGTPKAPTAAAGTSTTQIATCAFVQKAVAASAAGAADWITERDSVNGWDYALYESGAAELHLVQKMGFGTSVGWVAQLDYPGALAGVSAAHVTATDYRVEQLYCSAEENGGGQIWIAGRASEECDCEVYISVYGRWK